jgi:branched-chain amino acid transport system substrate-binding protein
VVKKSFPDFEPGFDSLEGFVSAKTLVAILRKAGKDITVCKVLSAAGSVRVSKTTISA